jgi:hypothetical protein
MRRIILASIFLLLAFCLIAQDFEGVYNILPKSKSIFTSMEFSPETITLKNEDSSSIFIWKKIPETNLIIISGLGYYYEFKDNLLILSPAFEQADVIYAERKI